MEEQLECVESDDDHVQGCDISSLFTNTDYISKNLQIPCHDQSQQDPSLSLSTIDVDVVCSNSASTDYDLTGQIVWPVSVLLAHFVASKKGQELVSGKNIIELGAGCGLPGLVATHFADKVHLTDGNETVMDLLERNHEVFSTKCPHLKDKVTVSQLVWGDRYHYSRISEGGDSSFDVVLAADVVQWPSVVEPLLHSIKAHLWESKEDHPLCILGIVKRAESTHKLFFDLSEQLGFESHKVKQSAIFKDGKVPDCCVESGGRIAEVFILYLVDRTDMPELLKANGTKDLTLGNNFEKTLFLPF